METEVGQKAGETSRSGRLATATVIVLTIVGAGMLLARMAGFLLLVFAAVVLAVVFDAITRLICSKLPIKRGIALALAIILLLGVFVGAIVLFGAQLTSEFDTIRQSLPGALDDIQAYLDRMGLGQAVNGGLEEAQKGLSSLLSKAGTYVLAFGNAATNIVLVTFAAAFLAADPGVYRRGFLLLMPGRAVETADLALHDSHTGLKGWMRGQAISSLVVAALTSTGLALLGVPSAAGLGVIAGLLDVVPMIGPVLSGLPAVLLAFTKSPVTALWTLLLFLVVQQMQGNFLQPMIQKQAVDVPPAVLLFSVVAFGILFGLMGVLLAAPLTIVTFVLVKRIYVKTLLGKDVQVTPDDKK